VAQLTSYDKESEGQKSKSGEIGIDVILTLHVSTHFIAAHVEFGLPKSITYLLRVSEASPKVVSAHCAHLIQSRA
jgi:hypothetical protein